MFRTMYDRVRVTSNTGDPIVIEYTARFDENGNLELVESGKRNLYQEIQADKDVCDINKIIARYRAGDESVLQRRQGFFADATQFPKNYAEMLNIVINGEREFDSLPVEVKNKFDNDFAKFVASIGTPDWFDKIGFKPESASDEGKPEDEVKNDE